MLPKAGDPRGSSTVYFCTADRDGMMVSFIQSNYRGFGSGIVIPGTGISMNDRMENFRFDPAHANCLEGGKRPYHTIIPGFLSKPKSRSKPSRYSSENDVLIEKSVKYTDFFCFQ